MRAVEAGVETFARPLSAAADAGPAWFGLVKAIEQLSAARSSDAVVDILRATVRHVIGADGICIVQRDGEMAHYLTEDAIAPLWAGQRFPLASCVSGWSMLQRQTAVIPDVTSDPRVPQEPYAATFVRSLVMVPVGRPEPRAAIGAYWARAGAPTDDAVAMLEAIARSTATALENIRLVSELRASEERFRGLAETIRGVFYVFDLSGPSMAYISKGYETLFGRSRESLYEEPLSFLEAIHPDDRARVEDAMRRQASGAESTETEYRLVRDDGSVAWMWDRAYPVADGPAGSVRVLGLVEDVTAQRQTEERLRLLAEELDHRTRNVMAVARSLAAQTLSTRQVDREVRDALDARLDAFGAAHGLLARLQHTAVDVRQIAETILAPHATSDGRVRIAGPEVGLPPQASVSLALALHELATNAAKHGALSVAGGAVELGWQIEASGGRARMRMLWRESGGPVVTAPTRRGFGSRMIERNLAAALDGSVEVRFEPTGVVAEIVALLDDGGVAAAAGGAG